MNGGMMRSPRLWRLFIASILLLLGTTASNAQATPIPITVGQNLSGTLAEAPVQYNLSIDTPQSIRVQVLGISAGLAPSFRVLDPNGIVITEAANNTGVTIVEGSATLSVPGVYSIEVSSANHTPGDFLISVQPGSPLLPPAPLVLGELQNGEVDSETARLAYSFSASSTDVLLVTVQSDDETSGVGVALRDAETNGLFALSNAQLGGVRYRILTGATHYLLEVTFPGGEDAQTYRVCLETESGSVTCSGDETRVQPALRTTTPETVPQSAATPTLNPNGACTVQSASAASVNVRNGPSTGFGVVAHLPLGSTASVIARLSDQSWFQINVGGVIGWVSAGVVTLNGNCTGVGVVVPPPAPPTLAPTTLSTQMAATVMISPTTTLTASSTPPATVTATEPGPFSTLPVFEPMETRPDLTLMTFYYGAIRDSNGTPVAPKTYSAVIAMVNNGFSSTGPYTLRMCQNGACFDYPYPGLAAGQAYPHQIDFLPGLTGTTVSLIFAIDFVNDIDEADETNNLYTTEIYFEP